jgi:hypothetical protein
MKRTLQLLLWEAPLLAKAQQYFWTLWDRGQIPAFRCHGYLHRPNEFFEI